MAECGAQLGRPACRHAQVAKHAVLEAAAEGPLPAPRPPGPTRGEAHQPQLQALGGGGVQLAGVSQLLMGSRRGMGIGGKRREVAQGCTANCRAVSQHWRVRRRPLGAELRQTSPGTCFRPKALAAPAPIPHPRSLTRAWDWNPSARVPLREQAGWGRGAAAGVRRADDRRGRIHTKRRRQARSHTCGAGTHCPLFSEKAHLGRTGWPQRWGRRSRPPRRRRAPQPAARTRQRWGGPPRLWHGGMEAWVRRTGW